MTSLSNWAHAQLNYQNLRVILQASLLSFGKHARSVAYGTNANWTKYGTNRHSGGSTPIWNDPGATREESRIVSPAGNQRLC